MDKLVSSSYFHAAHCYYICALGVLSIKTRGVYVRPVHEPVTCMVTSWVTCVHACAPHVTWPVFAVARGVWRDGKVVDGSKMGIELGSAVARLAAGRCQSSLFSIYVPLRCSALLCKGCAVVQLYRFSKIQFKYKFQP